MKLSKEPSASRIGEDEIQAFVDDVLDDARRNELLAHIAAHPHEAERVDAYFRQRTALQALSTALADDDDAAFCPDLQRRLEASLRRQRAFRVVTRIAAAIALLVPLGWGGTLIASHLRQSPVQVASTPKETLNPSFPFGGYVEPIGAGLGADGAQSLALLTSYLDSAKLVVPDLETLGLKLVGGDTVTGVEPPAARLVYADELGNRLAVFVGIASSKAPQAFTMVPEGHLSLNWRSGPLVFSVVGPVEMPKLHELMRLVSGGINELEVPKGAPGEVTASKDTAIVEPVALPDTTGSTEHTPKVLPADQPSGASGHPGELGKEKAKVL